MRRPTPLSESRSPYSRSSKRVPEFCLCRHGKQLSGGGLSKHPQLRCSFANRLTVSHPGARILEAKQRILFNWYAGFANASFEQAIGYFDWSIAIGQYNRQIKADALYWRGESYYRLNRMQEATRNFNEYLQLTRQTNNEMYALAHYNWAILLSTRKTTHKLSWFLKYIQLEKGENRMALADAYNHLGDCFLNERSFDEAKQYYAQAENSGDTIPGDYSFYQLALVSGLQKDYSGKITLLNRLVGKYSSSLCSQRPLWKGRSYVLMDNNSQAISSFKDLLTNTPKVRSEEKPPPKSVAVLSGRELRPSHRELINRWSINIREVKARLGILDLKSIYVDMNRIDEFAALAAAMPGNIPASMRANRIHWLTLLPRKFMDVAASKKPRAVSINTCKHFLKGLSVWMPIIISVSSAKNRKTTIWFCFIRASYWNIRIIRFSKRHWWCMQRYNSTCNSLPMHWLRIKCWKKRQPQPTAYWPKQGMLRCAYLIKDDTETIHEATDLVGRSQTDSELGNEALYYRAKVYMNQRQIKGTGRLTSTRQRYPKPLRSGS